MEYNVCTSSMLTDPPPVKKKQIHKNHTSSKKCKSYYICLGTLVDMIQAQIENRYAQNSRLYLIGCRYLEDLYKWVNQCKYKELFANEFFKSLVTSIALFAMGVKLTNELDAWKAF
ncbi:hypothetical protein ANTPLA_LOCUS6010 [Anthophora plagiata]